jgi:hypothetical protein
VAGKKSIVTNQEIKMKPSSAGPAMSQKIFSMNLDVEAVSLYLLCCAVADAGAAITRSTLQEKWNGSRATLDREIGKLMGKNILCRDNQGEQEDPSYLMVDEKKWH